jgi:hypothetical protein
MKMIIKLCSKKQSEVLMQFIHNLQQQQAQAYIIHIFLTDLNEYMP